MKWKKIASLLLITALFLSFLGCGERAQPESTAPDDSALIQMRQYQSSMEAFQSDCTQQIHAFTASLQSGDTEAGNAAADTLTTRLAGFEKIPVPSGCQEIQPFFAKAKKKMDTIYALMIQILGDGQYTNDDMANLTALKTAAGVFAESYQFGLGLLEQALDR